MILLCGTCSCTVWKQTSAVLLYHSFTILACSGNISATLLPQNQNFSQMKSILLFCYLSSRIFRISHLINILLFCYLSRIFVTNSATLLSLKQSHFSAECFMISYYNESTGGACSSSPRTGLFNCDFSYIHNIV